MVFGIGFVVVIGLVFVLFGGGDQQIAPQAQAHEAVVYREATCGCCSQYVAYLKRKGYEVDDRVVSNINEIKAQHMIPQEMMSCHTAMIDGYVIEGHMPLEVIEKLLAERPEDLRGIALPGMPSGSPGMPGAKQGSFQIHGLMYDSIEGGRVGMMREFMRF